MFNSIDDTIQKYNHRSHRPGGRSVTFRAGLLPAVLTTALLLLLAVPAQAAPQGNQPPPQTQGVTVKQSGDTLLIKGENANAGDLIRIDGIGGTLQVQYNGATVGTFQFVQHIDVDIWGFKSVGVLLVGVQIKGQATIATDRGSDGVVLVNCVIAGTVNVNTGPGDDGLLAADCTLDDDLNVDTTDGADHIVIQGSLVSGDATLLAGAGESHVLIDANDLGSMTYVDSEPDGSTVSVWDNRIRDNLLLMTGGNDLIEVEGNVVDSDVLITTGATSGTEFVAVRNENQIHGNLSIDVADCGLNFINVVENAVDHDTSITLGLSTVGWNLEVYSNLLRGNATLDIASSVRAFLDDNSIVGNLQVSTSNEPDLVSLTRSMCHGMLIDLSGGDDDLELGYPTNPGAGTSTFSGSVSVYGGAGSDTLYHDVLNSYSFPPMAQGFETVVPF